MKITVQGRSPQGHNFLVRANRFWPTGHAKLVEVVDVKAGEYEKTVDANGNLLDPEKRGPCVDGDDPPPLPVERKNPTTGRMETKLLPDPERIGRNSYAELEADKRLVIKQTDTVSQGAADAAIQAARGEVTRLSNELLEARSRIAALESGSVLKDALSEIVALKEQLAAAAAPAEDAGSGGKKRKG